MAVLGLDIGSDTIKVVELAKARGGYRLLNYGLSPTPPDSVANGDVQDPELLGDAIRQLLAGRKIKGKVVVSAVQGQQSTVIRIIDLPRMGQKELTDTMPFEVERHIPFAASQIIMDYAILQRPGEPADSPNMEVLFAAAQEEMINVHVEALKRAKVKPQRIDVQPLALARALVERGTPGAGLGETVAVVNIGATVTDLSIIKDGLLHFPRTIPIAGRSVTQRLSEGLGISEQQAERMKRQYASLRPLPPELVAAAATRPAPAEEQEKAVDTGIEFGADLFDLDTADDSDVGFGGTGTGQAGLSFVDSEDDGPPLELHVEGEDERSAFEISDDLGSEGPTFDFGFDSDDSETKFSLAPDDDDDEADDAPVPADEGFRIDLPGDDESDDDVGFAFELPTEDPDETDQPAAFDLGADEPASGEETFEFDLGSADDPGDEPAASAAASDSGDALSFDLGSTDEPAGEAPGSETFDFDLGSSVGEPSAPGSDDLFDFDLGSESHASSIDTATGSSEGGATDIGPSYDLGSFGSLDEGVDLGEVVPGTESPGFGALAEPEVVQPPAARPAAAAPGHERPALEPISADDEERLRVRAIIEPVVREIAGELGRSLEYYRSKNNGAVVDRIVLVGGTARIEGLAEFFEEALGIPVEYGDPLAQVTVANHKLSDDDLRRDAPMLTVAIGLAMGELG